jgi:hypothetical protein
MEYLGALKFQAQEYDLASIPDNDRAAADAADMMFFIRMSALLIRDGDEALEAKVRADAKPDDWISLLEGIVNALNAKRQDVEMLEAGVTRLQVVLERVVGPESGDADAVPSGPAEGPPPPADDNGPDPIFAAIEARRAAWTALNDSPEDGDVPHALIAADDAAILVMLRTPPTTLQGIKALLRYIVGCEEDGELLNLIQDGYDRPAGEILARTLLTALERLA